MRLRIVDKAAVWHQRAIDRALRLLTLGQMSGYLDRYVTTIGHTIYVPSSWPALPVEEREDVLRHERVHVAQFERYGAVLMTVLYLLVPLPVGLAYFRMRLEREAYEETIRAAYERGGRVRAEALREHILRRFEGPDYLWMWPFRKDNARWFDEIVDRLQRIGL